MQIFFCKKCKTFCGKKFPPPPPIISIVVCTLEGEPAEEEGQLGEEEPGVSV